MKHLPLPCTDADDNKKIVQLCKKQPWTPHQADWLATYQAYRAAGSDPWTVRPHTFAPDISKEQRQLYETRKNGGPIQRIRRGRTDLKSCPLCGSPSLGSIDHLLPRDDYPEFSIMRANLVPACVHCNSASKGNKHRGNAAPERFIHPYYDQFADQALWCVRINNPASGTTFDPEPSPALQGAELAIVRYHLAHVLGHEFHRFMASLWSTLPGSVAVGLAGSPVTLVAAQGQIAIDLQRELVASGENGWKPAFLRGLVADFAALQILTQRAIAYPA